MLTPKHTIWDEIPNALQTYKKKQYKKLLSKFFEKNYSGEIGKKHLILFLYAELRLPQRQQHPVKNLRRLLITRSRLPQLFK